MSSAYPLILNANTSVTASWRAPVVKGRCYFRLVYLGDNVAVGGKSSARLITVW
jgi:hypothetical protein